MQVSSVKGGNLWADYNSHNISFWEAAMETWDDVSLDISCSAPLEDSEDPYIDHFEIRVLVTRFSEDDKIIFENKAVGRASATYVAIDGAINAHYPILYSFDQDDELAPVHRLVIDRRGWLKAGLTESWNRNILYIYKLYIEEEFRGRKLGTKVLARIIQVLGRGAGIAALKPWPIKKTDEGLDVIRGKERAKWMEPLRRFYQRMGFKPLGRSSYMFLDLEGFRPGEYLDI